MASSLEDPRGDSPAKCGDLSFNKIKEEMIRAAGGNPKEVERLLTERILMDFLQFHTEKPSEKKKKRTPLESDVYSVSLNWKYKRQRKKPVEKKKKRVVLRIIPPKKPLELAPNNTGNINKNEEKEEEEKEEKSRKTMKQRKNPTKIKQEVPDRPPCIPTEFKDKIMGLQGSDINLVIQKELTSSDMNASQARLSIPRGQMRYDFLSREEQVSLDEKEGTRCKGMEVPLIEPSLQVSTIFLKMVKCNRVNKNYMLSKPWRKVAERNQLEPSNTIQLWSFRVDQKLHLALIKLEN
ncbi:hypothetical protein FH972_004785 [Carpinus fangiana]|uniref:TF-B3 domain-containing protein n=1 Tax=Carpinus fangiana TaxID=176857 RepID=A0A5N6QM96_9ROSI|nr:hypothetical protein FH972_004785 [Carpinus fangiana]